MVVEPLCGYVWCSKCKSPPHKQPAISHPPCYGQKLATHSSLLPLLSLFVHLRTAATNPLTTMMTGVINARMNVREPTNADGQVCSETLRPSFLAQGTEVATRSGLDQQNASSLVEACSITYTATISPYVKQDLASSSWLRQWFG